MFVEFVTSLGRRDAQRVDVENFDQCQCGAVVEVSDSVGNALCSKCPVTGITFARPAEAPKKVKAIAPEPEIKGADTKDKK